ncbi:MAG: M3 family peptidase, partial [Sphingomicrobium sp.]
MKNILLGGVAALTLGGCMSADRMIDGVSSTIDQSRDAMGPQGAPVAQADAVAVPDNVLLADWTCPYDGVPPWDKVRPELFDQAIQFGVDEQAREYRAITDNPEAPSFANTIEAGERAGQRLNRVMAVFGVMTDNMSTPAYEAIEKAWSPKLSAAFDAITLDPTLFQRVENLYNNRDQLGLDAKQMRVLTKTYDAMVHSGAKLDPAGKAQLTQINQDLSSSFSAFNSKLLADEG